MFHNLQDLLPKAAIKYNMAKTLKAVQICHECNNAIEEISSETLENAKAKTYKDNILTITATNPAWAQKIQVNKHIIIKKIQKKFGKNTPKEIKIKIN